MVQSKQLVLNKVQDPESKQARIDYHNNEIQTYIKKLKELPKDYGVQLDPKEIEAKVERREPFVQKERMMEICSQTTGADQDSLRKECEFAYRAWNWNKLLEKSDKALAYYQTQSSAPEI